MLAAFDGAICMRPRMTFDVDLGAVQVVGRDDARAALADRLSKLVEAVVVDLVRSMREARGGSSWRVILSSLNPDKSCRRTATRSPPGSVVGGAF